MASRNHDFIVSAIVRKVRQHGFKVIYLDGRHQDVSVEKLELPHKIINHRPDVIGENNYNCFCIGEAKIESDLLTERTKNQLKDFFQLVNINPQNKLILGVPLNDRGLLDNVLNKLGMINKKQIEVIVVPGKLLPNEKEI